MKKSINYSISLLAIIVIVYLLFRSSADIIIKNPLNDALFPADFPSPHFEWISQSGYKGKWLIELRNHDGTKIVNVIDDNHWQPSKDEWERIKKINAGKNIRLKINKYGQNLRSKSVVFSISKDSVGAPVLYRRMPLPFSYAEKHLDSMDFVLIDFSSYENPHIAMRGFPVCGNCHSLTANGSTIGVDLDAGMRDKGGYFISNIGDTVFFSDSNYMSWTRIENRRTFGLFSKISPDGRYIVTTVEDKVMNHVFPFEPAHIAFSQIFFPVNGKLAVYDRIKKELHELPGANLDEYVQSNAIWSPDGKYIIFCRAPALPYSIDSGMINVKDENIAKEFLTKKRKLKYDICKIPFNEGKGGKAEPIIGASNNGKSNYFPAISPDGKWVVFCQSDNYMLLQPDSRLFIVPFKGGKSQLLKCNLSKMNSWHAWSPNGKWIAFVSKGLSIYTDLFLTHIDEKGNASVPVLVDRARSFRRVVNYPEFVNIPSNKKFVMVYDYIEITHIQKAIYDNDIPKARELYYKFIKQHHNIFPSDYHLMIKLLESMGLPEEIKKIKDLEKTKTKI